jgi:hypothetical protein
VPYKARVCAVLLNAIFALSARHFGQTHNDAQLKHEYNVLADRYNDRCLRMMRDLTNSPDYQPHWTEHLFAADVILQVMEEMNGTSAMT